MPWRADPGNPLSTTTTTYSYDGLGKRLQASTGTTSSQKTNFLWEVNRGLPQVAQERNGSNSLVPLHEIWQGG